MNNIFGDDVDAAREALLRGRMVGKRVKALEVEAGEGGLRFLFEEGAPIVWDAVGDCCSETWFAEVIGADALLRHTVTGVAALELPDDDPRNDDGNTRQDSDQIYGVEITTDAGRCQIIFRNSSNGYYGGSFDWDPEADGAGDSWQPITGDWTAYETKPKEAQEESA